MIQIKVKKITETAQLPRRMTLNSAGYDLYSDNSAVMIIKPGKAYLVPTGIAIALPPGYEAQIRPRSGLAVKKMLGILNSPGTIDSDYRGEIKIIIVNHGKEKYRLEPGTRIAQMVISKHETVDFQISSDLDRTDRGSGGFGHTSVD